MRLPAGYYLSSDGVRLSNVVLFETSKALDIHDSNNKVIGSIMAPIAVRKWRRRR